MNVFGYLCGLFDVFIKVILFQVVNILKYLFPVPKDDLKRVVTFSNQEEYISFRYMLGKGISSCQSLMYVPTYVVL